MNKPQSILYLHASAELFGSDYVLLSLLKSLDKLKYTPLVILPFHGPLCDELDKEKIEYQIHDIPVLRRQFFTPPGIMVFAVKMVKCILLLKRLVKARNVYAFHTNTSAVWVGGIVAMLTRRSHYWQVMELVERPRLVSWLMRKMVGHFSTRVFCISNAVRDFFIEANPKKQGLFETVYHGVDESIYNTSINGQELRRWLGLHADTVLVTFAGRFSAWKGQEVLATAMPIVAQRVKNVHVLFIGSCFQGQEHYETELKEHVARQVSNGCSATVLGFQNNLPEWLAATDIFILPSTSPEPNATVTIAAMAMGIPVVGTNIGGTPEAVMDGISGLLVEPNNSEQLAEAIIKISSDTELRQSMGHAGLERFKKMFSIKKYCKKVTAAYE